MNRYINLHSNIVSIIVPVYNVAQYIEDCLSSVIQQTITECIECIIVDDCGQDDSMTIATRFISNYSGPISFRILHHEANRGLSCARNTGLKAASGEYIYFLDSDDCISNDCLENLIKPLNTEKYDIIVGNFRVNPNQNYHTRLNLPDGTIIRNEDILEQYGSFNIYMMAVNKLCNRRFLLENKLFFFDGILHEDELWSYKIAVHTKSMYIVGSHTYIYNIREGSIMTSSKRQRRIDDLLTVCKEMVKISKEHNLLYNYYSNRCITNVISKPLSLCSNEDDTRFLYNTIFKTIGLRAKYIAISDLLRPRTLIHDLHWLLPKSVGFWIYKRIKRLSYK